MYSVNLFNLAAIKFFVFNGFIALKSRFFLVVLLCYNDEQIYLRILIFVFYNNREIREN